MTAPKERLCAVSILAKYEDKAGDHDVHSVEFYSATSSGEADRKGRQAFVAKWERPGLKIRSVLVQAVPRDKPPQAPDGAPPADPVG